MMILLLLWLGTNDPNRFKPSPAQLHPQADPGQHILPNAVREPVSDSPSEVWMMMLHEFYLPYQNIFVNRKILCAWENGRGFPGTPSPTHRASIPSEGTQPQVPKGRVQSPQSYQENSSASVSFAQGWVPADSPSLFAFMGLNMGGPSMAVGT